MTPQDTTPAYDYREIAAMAPVPVCHTPGLPSKARMLREALGMSLRQLAREIDYDHGYLSKAEVGKRGWSLYSALAWMDHMTLRVAEARAKGFQIPDSAIPTLRELASMYPERRVEQIPVKPAKKSRARGARAKAKAKGGKGARRQVSRGRAV